MPQLAQHWIRRQLLQALVWGGFTALMLYISASFRPLDSGTVAIMVVVAAGLWISSDVLRHLALSQGWLSRFGFGLLLRIALALVLLPVAVQLLVYVVVSAGLYIGWLQIPGGKLIYTPGAMVLYWFNSAMPLALWTAAWLTVHAVQRFRQGELSRLRAEASRSALEFDALRARLNPHFVFNALNNLRALINEDTERARELVTRLSNTLRHALDHGGAHMVPLSTELAVVDDYLAIEQVHYEQRLQIRRDIADAALDAELPPMLLQLLVENAIKHGIACTPGGGLLRISARIEDDQLCVEVENPGRVEQGSQGHGVGLAYLRARLAQDLPHARFALEACDGSVRAILTIPQAGRANET